MNDLEGRLFRKRRFNGVTSLVPADPIAEEWLDKIKLGGEVMLTPRRVRNPKHHRLLFALLNIAVQNDPSGRWPSVEVVLDELKLATGLFETRVNLTDRKAYAVTKSISFASMSQDEFDPWFDRAMDIIAIELCIDNEVLRREIAALVAENRAFEWRIGERTTDHASA